MHSRDPQYVFDGTVGPYEKYAGLENGKPSRFGNHWDPFFAEELTYRLRLLSEQEEPRRRIYGDETDDSRIGHTPPETRARFNTKEHNLIRSYMENQEPSTPEEIVRARPLTRPLAVPPAWKLAQEARAAAAESVEDKTVSQTPVMAKKQLQGKGVKKMEEARETTVMTKEQRHAKERKAIEELNEWRAKFKRDMEHKNRIRALFEEFERKTAVREDDKENVTEESEEKQNKENGRAKAKPLGERK
ncbi:hypothetical protein OPT61_g1977 [Boeremia exigua]|uniref:Uncharacterized protein n=1 Tax=Boeremia exigua TaxID=749465 RepID=A0ACC2IN82_9PLEO|nr:hypothetical protein OPT61_g1977 [Boeremia exigua]